MGRVSSVQHFFPRHNHLKLFSEKSGEEREDVDRMEEDTIPPTQSDPNDLSAYKLDEYDNDAADAGKLK